MNLRITALVYMACFAAAQMGLYVVKYSVQGLQKDVEKTRVALNEEKESLHLLKAEWAYLNRPDRLQRLATRHLNLVPLDSKRINDVNVLPAAVRSDEGPSLDSLYQPINQVEEK